MDIDLALDPALPIDPAILGEPSSVSQVRFFPSRQCSHPGTRPRARLFPHELTQVFHFRSYPSSPLPSPPTLNKLPKATLSPKALPSLISSSTECSHPLVPSSASVNDQPAGTKSAAFVAVMMAATNTAIQNKWSAVTIAAGVVSLSPTVLSHPPHAHQGHPSCLCIESIAIVVHAYDWYCIECKTCEVCLKKGHGVCPSLLFRLSRSLMSI